MSAAVHELIAECARRRIHLEAAGDNLRYEAPKGALTPDLTERIRACKGGLLQALQSRWNPELAAEGYVWCLDCRHYRGQRGQLYGCNHPDNPYRKQEPRVPRYCRWFVESGP